MPVSVLTEYGLAFDEFVFGKNHRPTFQSAFKEFVTEFQNQNWFRKFANAIRGIRIVVTSQRSFWVHLVFAVLVSVLAIALKVSLVEGMILAICITLVMTAEMINTSIEYLSRKVTLEESEQIRDSLDAASGAVLVASIGSATIGLFIVVPKILVATGIWA